MQFYQCHLRNNDKQFAKGHSVRVGDFRADRRAPAPTEPDEKFSPGSWIFPVILTARPPAGAHFGGWREDVKSRKARRSVWSGGDGENRRFSFD